MQRFWRVWLAMLVVALIATFVLAMPQAAAVGAPDRGLVASGVTMAAFFSASIVVVALLASAGGLALEGLLGRLGWPWPAALAAASAALCLGLALAAVPGVLEIRGLLGGWLAAAAAGRLAVVDDAAGRVRLRCRRLLPGVLAAVATGLALLWLSRSP